MTLAWYDPTNKHVSTDKHDPLFTPLGQVWPLEVKREWVGLTKEEIDAADAQTWDEDHKSWGIHDFARHIEAKLKEKNT